MHGRIVFSVLKSKCASTPPAPTPAMDGGIRTFLKKKKKDARDKNAVTCEQIIDLAQHRLPPPPPGSEWVKEDSGDWIIVETPTTPPLKKAEVVEESREHMILPTDTLPGLCLRYKVKPRALSRANPLLDVSAPNPLRGLVALVIPGKGGVSQPRTLDVDIARIRAECPSLSRTEARCYVDGEADVDEAVARAKADLAWEASATAPPPAKKTDAVVLDVVVNPIAEASRVPLAEVVAGEAAAPEAEASAADSVLAAMRYVGEMVAGPAATRDVPEARPV